MPETNLAQTQAEQALRVVQQSPLIWGHFYFPHHFPLQTPAFHIEIMRAVHANRFLAIASPRESSKSTLISFLYVFHQIIFQLCPFIIIVMNTFKKASLPLETIKKELQENTILRASFPGITLVKDAEGDAEFRSPNGYETKVLCRGVDQLGGIRGLKFGPSRPQLILGDDMEDDELVRSVERRRQLQEDFDHALIPAGDTTSCRYLFIGTILHDDSQLAKLVSSDMYPEYQKLIYQALQPNGTSLWPEKWTAEKLKTIAADKPSVFAKEYQNDPVAGAAQKFHAEDFRTWRQQGHDYCLLDEGNQILTRGSLKDCRAAIACDLAWEQKRDADFCVLLPGLLTPQSEILVAPYLAKRGMRPGEIEEVLFQMEERYRLLTGSPVAIGFEKAKLEKVMVWLLREAMKRRNHFLLFKDLIWDADKLTRIETRLQPRYAQHVIYHQPGMGELEHQLLRFPSGSHDDLPDALQGLVQLLHFPKSKKAETQQPDAFMRMRQLAMKRHQPQAQHGLFHLTAKEKVRRQFPVMTSPL